MRHQKLFAVGAGTYTVTSPFLPDASGTIDVWAGPAAKFTVTANQTTAVAGTSTRVPVVHMHRHAANQVSVLMLSGRILSFTSCMEDNAEATCRAIVAWLGDALNVETEFVDCVGWEERERMLDAGEIDVCWICGLPYVWKADAHAPVEICAVPVMRVSATATSRSQFEPGNTMTADFTGRARRRSPRSPCWRAGARTWCGLPSRRQPCRCFSGREIGRAHV
mgnify:CR=1 FL=1